MYFNIGPSKKDLYKIILLLICLLFTFRGCANAMVYSTDVSYYERRSTPLGYPNKRQIYLAQANPNSGMGVITYNFSSQFVVSCETDTCLIVIPYTAMVVNETGTTISNSSISNVYINDFSFTAQVGGPSYFNVCSGQDNNIECVVPNNTILSSMDLIINLYDCVYSNESFNFFEFQTLGFWLIYNIGQNSQAIQETADNTEEINNTINDSSIDENSASDLTSNSAFQDQNGLQAIIQAPLNFIQSLTSTTCSAISLTIPYIDANVSLPCMSSVYNKALGQQLVDLIALVINGVVLYRYCLKILQIVKDAKNPNKDGLEVLDL